MAGSGSFTGSGITISPTTVEVIGLGSIDFDANVQTFYKVEQIAPATLRIYFSKSPLCVNPLSNNDVQNIKNYVLTGNSSISVNEVRRVSGSTKIYDLWLTSPIQSGEWLLTVNNVQTWKLEDLDNNSLFFYAKSFSAMGDIADGASPFTMEDVVKQHINPSFKGANWDSILTAIGINDEYLKGLAEAAFDQLFASTASGKYLERLAANRGMTKPLNVGINDSSFRDLIISFTNEKVTLQSFLKILNVFYGDEALRAHVNSLVEPFALENGDDLFLEIDSKLVKVTFSSDDFQDISAAEADEVAAVINAALSNAEMDAFAILFRDALNNTNSVRIYSGALGLRGNIRVLGGKAQNVLQFPTLIASTQASGTEWDVDNFSTDSSLLSGRLRFTWTGNGTDPSLNLVNVGNSVNIYGTVFSSVNRGNFLVKDVGVDYFEVENVFGVDQTGVVQGFDSDIVFFSRELVTINNGNRVSFAAQASDSVDVILQATTQIVGRNAGSAAYPVLNTELDLNAELSISSISRSGSTVTIQTTTNHGLASGMKFYLGPGQRNFNPGEKTIASTPTANTLTYSEDGFSVSGTTNHKLFLNYRKPSGDVVLTTSAAHGLTSGRQILAQDLVSDTYAIRKPHWRTLSTTNYAPRRYGAQLKLNNGKILLTSGVIGPVPPTASCKIYDPETDTWTTGASLTTARVFQTATLLQNGRVLVAGGYTDTNKVTALSSCQIYDPELDIFVDTNSMGSARGEHTAVLLPDGKVWVAGGFQSGGSIPYDSTEIFDPVTETWSAGPTLTVAHAMHGCTKIDVSRYLITFGVTTGPARTDTADVFNYSNSSIVAADGGGTFHARSDASAIYVPEIGVSGSVIVAGGYRGASYSNQIVKYDVATGTWELMSIVTPTAQDAIAVCQLSNKDVFYTGGRNYGASSKTFFLRHDDLSIDSGVEWLEEECPERIQSGFAILMDNGEVFVNESLPYMFVYDSETKAGPAPSGLFNYTNLNTRQITFVDSRLEASVFDISSAKVFSVSSPSSTTTGPYIYQPNDGVSLTGTATTLNQNIAAGSQYTTISVTDASSFPENGGLLVFSYGYDNQTSLVPYILRASGTSLLLDSGFTFPYDLPIGTNINLLKQKDPFNPENPQDYGTTYATDSVSARIAASDFIDRAAAAGANVVKTVVYPGDRGLGNEGYPSSGSAKIGDKVYIWGSAEDVDAAREE